LEMWMDNRLNHGRWVRAKTLGEELVEISNSKNRNFYFAKNPVGLGRKLSQLVPSLREFFAIDERTRQGTKEYCFMVKDDSGGDENLSPQHPHGPK